MAGTGPAGTRLRSLSDYFKVYGSAVAISLAGLAAAIWWMEPAPPSTLRLAAGAPGGVYHRWGEEYRRLLARQHIRVELVETAGAADNLARLARGEVDAAFIQAGLRHDEAAGSVEALASIGAEPAWIFADRDIRSLRDLEGTAIAGGIENSGTLALAGRLLDLAGLAGGTAVLPVGGDEAVAALRDGQARAAVFVSNDVTGPIAALLRDPDVQLLSVDQAEGLARRHPWLSVNRLFAGSLDYRNRLPAADIDLVSTTALLASSERMHPAFVDVLLSAAQDVHGQASLFSDLGQYPQEPQTEMAIDQGAIRYFRDGPTLLRRYLPFWAASFVERAWILVLPLLTVMFPLFKIAPPTYHWRIKRRINRYYLSLREVERQLAGHRSDAELEELSGAVRSLDAAAARTTVPITYMNDLYHLRRHIAMVQQRIRQQMAGR